MADSTPRFKLTTFNTTSDTLDYRDYKFSNADRVLLDKLLTLAAERHTHTSTGTAAPTEVPPLAPHLTYTTTGGIIPANAAIYYRTALIDERGQEHVASQTAVLYTPPAVLTPEPPRLVAAAGTLMAGDYVYALTAYTNDNTRETSISRTAPILLTSTGGVTLSLPNPPSGATGYNIYRKAPTDRALQYLATTTTNPWTDNGTLTPNSLRGIPTANTTNTTNKITITPAAALVTGQSLKIYRTYNPLNWDHSLLAWTTTTPVIDTGNATNEGSPLDGDSAVGDAPKVNLGTDSLGTPPPALTPTSTQITFTVAGTLTEGYSTWQWINEFDQAVILSLRASLGRGSTPSSQPVKVGLDHRPPDDITWTRLTDAAAISTITADIPIGDTTATVTVPDDALPVTHLTPGHALRLVIEQTGGGATPNDADLTASVLLAVAHGSATTTYPWTT